MSAIHILYCAYWDLDFTSFCHLTGLDESDHSLELFHLFQAGIRHLSRLDPQVLEHLTHYQRRQSA